MKRPPFPIVVPFVAALLGACASVKESPLGPIAGDPVDVRGFGRTSGGADAHAYVLRSPSGVEAVVTDFGATLVSLRVPDRNGVFADVVLGFDDVTGYEGEGNQYFGCTAGRVANRIGGGRFTLDGREFTLATNNGPNHLHGGERGFGQRLWTATPSEDGAEVKFVLESPNGEEGYPGTVWATVVYSLTSTDELVIDYTATTDAATPVNLTHHSYFNLAGAGAQSVLDHELWIGAAHYTPTDDTLIPTGEVAPVADTPLDFRVATPIGTRIALLDTTPALGYDHNYAVRDAALEPTLAAVVAAGPVCQLTHPGSGRVLEIFSDQPGLQFYSGNFLKGQTGKGGASYPHRSACCLETQGYPNAVNEPSFPNTVLRPGETYRQLTVHRFRVR